MKNIWYIFGTVIFAVLVIMIACIIIFIRKEKYFIVSEIILIVLAVFCLLSDIPYMKDIAEKETTEVVAMYVEYQKGNVHPGARRLIFKNDKETFSVLSPIITKDHVKMETGKTYRIVFFNNSKVIKDYILLE